LFLTYGEVSNYTSHKITPDNTLWGKPIYYYKNANMHNITVPRNAGQVIVANVSWLRIENLNIRNVFVPVEIYHSSHITIKNCALTENEYGIYLINVHRSVFAYNRITSTCQNILMDTCTNCIVEGNEMRHLMNGDQLSYPLIYLAYEDISSNILMYKCQDDIFISNIIKGYTTPSNVYIIQSEKIRMYKNAIEGRGITFDFPLYTHEYISSHYTSHDIASNNTLWGKPIYYYKNANMHNATVPHNAGQVIVANVSWLRMENLNISSVFAPVTVYNSSHIVIKNSSFKENEYGIYFIKVYESEISYNALMNNTYGIYLLNSGGNIIHRNTFAYNERYAIIIEDYELYYHKGDENTIYCNSFLYNNGAVGVYDPDHIQACDCGPRIHSLWYLNGLGNYWSDWTSPDNDGDGIVDEPYMLDSLGRVRDDYPLASPPT